MECVHITPPYHGRKHKAFKEAPEDDGGEEPLQNQNLYSNGKKHHC
jgi:hypothetical protein